MVRYSLLLLIVLLISACGLPQPREIHGIITDTEFKESYTEHIPAKYTPECGYGFDGKYECGKLKFVPGKTIYHSERYYFFIREWDCSESHRIQVSEDDFNALSIGDEFAYVSRQGQCINE